MRPVAITSIPQNRNVNPGVLSNGHYVADRTSARTSLLPATAAAPGRVTLPLLATGSDLRELVKALQKKPAGITIVQALNSDQRRLFDERKIAAYKFWGILEEHEERFRLTSFGQEFAQQLKQETEAYRSLLLRIEPYRAALEWIYHEELELVAFDRIATFWQQLYPLSEDLHDSQTVKGNVICLLHLCQSADLGIVTIGKRGQPARMRIARDELRTCLGTSRPANEPQVHRVQFQQSTPVHADLSKVLADFAICVFTSRGKDSQLVRQLEELLYLVDAQSVVVFRESGAHNLLPRQTLSDLRRCSSSITIINDEDLRRDETGELVLDDQIRIELGTACALFEGQIVLLWQSSAPVPADLREVQAYCVHGDDLTWEDGLNLVKLLKKIRH